MSHTPGPWTVTQRHVGVHRMHYIIFAGGKKLTDWVGDYDGEANACLIAAAPDLLAALKALTLGLTDDPRPAVKRAIVAIAKAEGHEP